MGAGCGRSKQRNIHNPHKVDVKVKDQYINGQKELINPNEFFKPIKNMPEDNVNKRVKCIKIKRDDIICTKKVSNDYNSHIIYKNNESIIKRKSTTDLNDIQLFSFGMSSSKNSDQSIGITFTRHQPLLDQNLSKENSNQSDFEEIQLTKRQRVLNETNKTILKEVMCKNVLKQVNLITPKSKGIFTL